MTITDRFIDMSQKVTSTPAFQNTVRGFGALQGSLEGESSDMRNLAMNPNTGRFDPSMAAKAALQSVATIEPVQEYLDKFLDSQYGQLLPAVAGNPNLQMALSKIPFASTALGVAMDRLSSKRFSALKANAMHNAGANLRGLTVDYEGLSQRFSGETMAGKTLMKFNRFNKGAGLDIPRFVMNADKLMQYEQGRSMTPAEKNSVRGAAMEMKKRAYDVKGVHAIYENTPGGLPGQRFKAAGRELGRLNETTGAKLRSSGAALQTGQGKMQELMNTQGPARREKGTYVNVQKFKDKWDSADKGASYSQISGYFSNIIDKIASEDHSPSGFVDAISDSDFIKRQTTKPKVFHRRNFEKYGGVNSYVNAKLYGNPETLDHKKRLLSNIFKKLKKELSFKDNITYTDSV